MRILGIIAEFNPLHNGHQYLINKAKAMTEADFCIVVMSGNYVQRGECALFHKDLRTKAALLSGADAVFEIPLCFATGSAEYFASASVALLTRLGCVTDLCFGSETGDLMLLQSISDLLTKETAAFQNALKKSLSAGLSFPAAREKAFREILGHVSDPPATPGPDSGSSPAKDFLPFSDSTPDLTGSNDILGIEYLRAINRLSSPLRPHVIRRLGAYHAEGQTIREASDHTETEKNSETPNHAEPPKIPVAFNSAGENCSDPGIGCFASAEQLRQALEASEQGRFPLLWEKEIPSDLLPLYRETVLQNRYLFPDALSLPLIQTLNYAIPEDLQEIWDMSMDLSNRVLSLRDLQLSFTGLISAVKSRNLTYTRISRALLHTILHITAEEVSRKKEDGYVQYASLLGFRRSSGDLLTMIKQKSDIPLITNVGDAARSLTKDLQDDYRRDLRRDAFYEKLLSLNAGARANDRTVYHRQIVVL